MHIARKLLPVLSISALIVVLDQATKALVRSRFELHQSVDVIPGVFSLTLVHNYGAAFGLMNSTNFPFRTTLLSLVAAATLLALLLYAGTLPLEQRIARAGLGLIAGGAAGNLIDRVSAGYVVDFVDLYWGSWHFWAFNVADAAITTGVVLMFWDMLDMRTRHVPGTV